MKMPVISNIAGYLERQLVLENEKITFSLLEKNPDAKLLDCGLGDGEFTLKVAERIGTRGIYGIDIVAESVIKAKAKGIQAYQGDLNEGFPFEVKALMSFTPVTLLSTFLTLIFSLRKSTESLGGEGMPS